MFIWPEALVDDGERALRPRRGDRGLTTAIVRGALGSTTGPVQADAIVACLFDLLAAIAKAVRSGARNSASIWERCEALVKHWELNILYARWSFFAALDLPALTLPDKW